MSSVNQVSQVSQKNWWCQKCGWFPEAETWKGEFPKEYVEHDCRTAYTEFKAAFRELGIVLHITFMLVTFPITIAYCLIIDTWGPVFSKRLRLEKIRANERRKL